MIILFGVFIIMVMACGTGVFLLLVVASENSSLEEKKKENDDQRYNDLCFRHAIWKLDHGQDASSVVEELNRAQAMREGDNKHLGKS